MLHFSLFFVCIFLPPLTSPLQLPRLIARLIRVRLTKAFFSHGYKGGAVN